MPGPFQILLLLFIFGGLLVLPVVALVEVIKSKFPENLQIIWVLVILLLPLIGSIIYFAVGRNQRIQ